MRMRASDARKAAASETSRPDTRDRTHRPATRMRASDARKHSARTPKPPLRSRFRSVKPRVSARSGLPRGPRTGGRGHGGGVRMRVVISSSEWEGPIRHLPGHVVERWSAILSGNLPEDDDVPPPPTAAQVDEAEQEATAEVEAWGRRREEEIQDQADEDRTAAYREAERIEDDAASADPRSRGGLMRNAQRVRERADERYRAAQMQMDRVAEQVREQRAKVRADLQRQVEAATERADERVKDLRRGIAQDMKDEANRHYFTNGRACDEVVDWDID